MPKMGGIRKRGEWQDFKRNKKYFIENYQNI